MEIRAIEITDNAIGDAPMLPCLLDRIADGESIARVSGDGTDNTKPKWKYSQQKISGGLGGHTAGGWDLSCNKSCA